jgi:hypothetical protein
LYQNKLYDGSDYLDNCLYPGLLDNDKEDGLKKSHFGCYDSFKKAILNDFDDDIDYLLICEGDCLFEYNHLDFINILNRVVDICDKNDIDYFSFGDIKTLEGRYLQSNILCIPDDQDLCFITDKIIGIQCIMFSEKIKNLLKKDLIEHKWYIMDGWFNDFCYRNNIKQGILFNRATSQYSGLSFIDNKIKKFN